VISILKSQKIEETMGSHGGGSLYQTFAWTERYDPCLAGYLPQELFEIYPLLDIQAWNNYDKLTEHPGVPFP
jgi:hypothetical protein